MVDLRGKPDKLTQKQYLFNFIPIFEISEKRMIIYIYFKILLIH